MKVAGIELKKIDTEQSRRDPSYNWYEGEKNSFKIFFRHDYSTEMMLHLDTTNEQFLFNVKGKDFEECKEKMEAKIKKYLQDMSYWLQWAHD